VQIFPLWNRILVLSAKRYLYDPVLRLKKDRILADIMYKSVFYLSYIIQ